MRVPFPQPTPRSKQRPTSPVAFLSGVAVTLAQSFNCSTLQRSAHLVSRAQTASETPHSHDTLAPRSSVGETALARAAGLFRAAGEPARLRLLELLSHGELCVTEVAAHTREELSTVSQRLRVLRAEHLVTRRREGKHVFYALADEHVADLIRAVLAHASEEPPRATARDDAHKHSHESHPPHEKE